MNAIEVPSPRVLLLAGGLGSRMREETEFRPKPMVEVGGRPLLWHIMRLYASHGLREFVVLLGYRGIVVKEYFLHYGLLDADFTIDLATGDVEQHSRGTEDWRVTLVDTGATAMTGARIARAAGHLGASDIFLCTYGDGLADVDIAALVRFHRAHGSLATVTGVRPPARFGRLVADGSRVTEFGEKPLEQGRINGGYFVFSRGVLDYLSTDDGCILERAPLERLAAAGELRVFEHDGFWQPADTVRDVTLLRELWDAGEAPWAPRTGMREAA